MKDPEEKEVLDTDEESFVENLGLGEEDSTDDDTKDDDTKDDDSKDDKDDDKDTDDEDSKDDENKDNEDDKDNEEEIKDLSQEEIDKLPKSEKGYYYAMKKERGKRQEAEAINERREIHDRYHKTDKKEEKEEKEEPEEKFETVEDILKDKADDDLLSVGEQRRIDIARKKEAAAIAKKAEKANSKLSKEQQREIDRMDELEESFKQTHSDYPEVYSVFLRAMKDIPSLRLEILAEAKRENGNPAKKAYDIGNKFKGVYTKEEKADPGKPKKDIKKIIKNAEKTTPSGSVPGSNVTNEALEEMDKEELGKTLSVMSMSEFMRVPRKIRNKALR